MDQLVQAVREDPQALVLSTVVGLAGVLTILTDASPTSYDAHGQEP